MSLLTQREIRDILPHRHPFLFVDAVLELGQDSIKCVKHITNTEPFLPGHFPDDPIFPGVLMVEACAQAGGIMLAKSKRYTSKGYLAQINDFKFLSFAVPGDSLVIDARYLSSLGDFVKVAVSITAGSRKIAKGVISYYFTRPVPPTRPKSAPESLPEAVTVLEPAQPSPVTSE